MLLVPSIMLAMAPQNLCRSSNLLPSGLQHCSINSTVEHACASYSICENPLSYLNARHSLQSWSSFFPTSTSDNLSLNQINYCCKQEVNSLESTQYKSRGSTGGNWSGELFSCHAWRKPWIFQQHSAVRHLQLLTQCRHVSPYHEHCHFILIYPYLSGQNLQFH